MADKWLYGKAVVGGEPQFHSVSRISSADPEEEGCARKWHFEMVMGRKGPKTRASARGDDAHSQLEKFLKTGERAFSSLVLGGMHMVPDPMKIDPATGRPDLIVEGDLVLRPGQGSPTTEAEAKAALAFAPVRIDGVPLLGRMDLVHWRGENKGATSLEEAHDPPGTVEVCDWKTTGDPRWIKKAKDLPRTIQMANYARWVFAVKPETEHVRLSHGYFVERGGPSRKVSLIVHREDVAGTWERTDAVARIIRHAAQERDPNQVDANTRACEKYGGCPHREVCKAGMHQALEKFVGKTAADRLTGKAPAQEFDFMGLLDKTKAAAASGAGPLAGIIPMGVPAAATAPEPAVTIPLAGPLAGIIPGVTPPAAPPPVQPDPAALAAERAKLEAEERDAREVEQLRSIYEKFEAYSRANMQMADGTALGTPAFGQAAATIYGRMRGSNPPAMGYAGTGTLGAKVMITSLEMAAAVLKQLDDLAAAGQIKAADSAPAAAPQPTLNQLLSPETSPPSPAVTVPATTSPTAGVNPAAGGGETLPPPVEEAPKATRAPRKKKTDSAPAPAVAPTGTGETGSGSITSPAITLYVNCTLRGIQAVDLRALVDEWCEALCKEFGTPDFTAADVRCAPDKSALSYGKWKGALAALVREEEIPPGVYQLDARGSEIAEVVAEAMQTRCRASGGTYVRGY